MSEEEDEKIMRETVSFGSPGLGRRPIPIGDLAKGLPLVTNSNDFASPEHAAEQYATVRAAEALIARLKEALTAYADTSGGIPLPNGKTLVAASPKPRRHRACPQAPTVGSAGARLRRGGDMPKQDRRRYLRRAARRRHILSDSS